jgi:hypothetical protein
VDVHSLDAAGLDDIAATQQVGQAEIDLRPLQWWRTPARRKVDRSDADVFQVEGRLQQVVVELVGLKLNVFLRQKRHDLVHA